MTNQQLTEERDLESATNAAELAASALAAAREACGEDPSPTNVDRLSAAKMAQEVAAAVVEAKAKALRLARERLAAAARERDTKRAAQLETILAPRKFEAAVMAPLRELAKARAAVIAANERVQDVARRHCDDLAEYDALCVRLGRAAGDVARIGPGHARALATLVLTREARKDGTAANNAASIIPPTSLDDQDLAFAVARLTGWTLQHVGTSMPALEQAERAARGEDVAAHFRRGQ